MKPVQYTTRSRPGFTLVELLVVITLIAILLALSASATVRVIEVQRKSNTEQIVKTLAEALDRQYSVVVSQFKKPTVIPPQVIALAGDSYERARVLWIKLNLMKEFPMTFAEATQDIVLSGQIVVRAKYANELRNVTPPNPSLDIQSSICLLLALQQSRSGTQFSPDTLGPHALADSPCTVGGRPLKMIVDGWTNQIAFFRWPTGNPTGNELNPATPDLRFNDSVDPTGLLCGSGWNVGWFQANVHALPNPSSTPRSYRVPPVVVSAGRDKFFGLGFPQMSIARQDQEDDNISSHRLRFGARGD